MYVYVNIYICMYGPTGKPAPLLKRKSGNSDKSHLFALPATNVKQQVFLTSSSFEVQKVKQTLTAVVPALLKFRRSNISESKKLSYPLSSELLKYSKVNIYPLVCYLMKLKSI